MRNLQLKHDNHNMNFISWLFEPKYNYFFNSLQDMGKDTWSDVVSEIKTEFGPYWSANAARRAIFPLKYRPNTEFFQFSKMPIA